MKRHRNRYVALRMARAMTPAMTLAITLALLAPLPVAHGRITSISHHDGLQQIPELKPLTKDIVHLDNGDKVSGSLLRLDDGMLVVKGELVEGEVRVPLRNVKLALFRTPEETPKLPRNRLVFPNGDRLSVTITGLKDGVLGVTTAAGQALDVKAERLTAIIFGRDATTVYENEFETGKLDRIKPSSGKWAVENGLLKQKERNASFSMASLEVTQDGRFQYEWVADLVRGSTYGFYFFAENSQSVQGGTAYLILSQGRSIYLYKVLNDNQQYYAQYNLPKRRKRTRFHLDYDPGNGNIILEVDGKSAFRYRDPHPIQSGRYMLLRADSVGSFDDIVIRRLGGGRVLATEAKARKRDIVSLTNNDEVSGAIIAIDGETVLMKTDYDEDPVDIQRTYVSSVTFYRQASRPAGPGSARITLINDDVVTGRLTGLDADTITIETDVLGEITLERALVRELRTGDLAKGAVGRVLDNSGAERFRPRLPPGGRAVMQEGGLHVRDNNRGAIIVCPR